MLGDSCIKSEDILLSPIDQMIICHCVKTLGLTILAPSKRFSAALPTARQQELLGATDIAFLCSSHVTYTQKEGELIPFEYTDTYYNGDLYAYTVESTEKLEHVGD